MDNYYKENCAGLARRVENFRGEFVKKRGIPAIAHASVSPVSIVNIYSLPTNGPVEAVFARCSVDQKKKKNQEKQNHTNVNYVMYTLL